MKIDPANYILRCKEIRLMNVMNIEMEILNTAECGQFMLLECLYY